MAIQPGFFRGQHAGAEFGAVILKTPQIRTLERKNGLFWVADRENGARHIPRGNAGEKIARDGIRDLPLRGRGVLHLIQQ